MDGGLSFPTTLKEVEADVELVVVALELQSSWSIPKASQPISPPSQLQQITCKARGSAIC
ncbi:hypothetical protein CDL15_Pgr015899 [Punica granatum]|uniref:Uncharacterized protein n=1 Tax=Punica granatum TaxID=22663 RepID=A0A218XPI0_PUNGR|nr:hypothetical protein CDL15_Pgr015899 [Punica granatum]